MTASAEIAVDPSDGIEVQLALVRSLPELDLRPTVSGVIYDPTTDQVMLCQSAKSEPGSDEWKFPQGGIKPHEAATEAFLREMEEELGLPPEAFLGTHGLADAALKGGWRNGREKLLLPMVGVIDTPREPNPREAELRAAQWTPRKEVRPLLESRPESRGRDNALQIFGRFSVWHAEHPELRIS